MSGLAEALASGGLYAKWDQLGMGASIHGTITAVDMRQSRKFDSTDLDFWDDGKPKMQVVLTLATDTEPIDADDDGSRSMSINLWSGQKRSLVAACKAAGVAEPVIGQTFTATWTTGVGNAKDPRQFHYQLGAAPTGLAGALHDEPVATAPPAAAVPVAVPVAAPTQDAVSLARQLLAAGIGHVEVAAATGLAATTVAALANLPAA